MDDNNYIDDEMIDEYIDTFPTVWKGEKTYQTYKRSIWDMRHLTNERVWSILRGGVS